MEWWESNVLTDIKGRGGPVELGLENCIGVSQRMSWWGKEFRADFVKTKSGRQETAGCFRASGPGGETGNGAKSLGWRVFWGSLL